MALLSSLIGGGVGLLGQRFASDDREDAAQAALEASRPIDTLGTTGKAVWDTGDQKFKIKLSPALMRQAEALGITVDQLTGALNQTDFEGREAAELERLREIRRPSIDRARADLQDRLLRRGRLGAGVGGGRTGRLFNPESAALEEAIFAADLGDIGASRDFARGDERHLLQQLVGASNLQRGILTQPESLAALSRGFTPPAATQALQAVPGFASADTTQGFFSSLGAELGNTDFGSLANRLFPQQAANLPPGARPNTSGGFFL